MDGEAAAGSSSTEYHQMQHVDPGFPGAAEVNVRPLGAVTLWA